MTYVLYRDDELWNNLILYFGDKNARVDAAWGVVWNAEKKTYGELHHNQNFSFLSTTRQY